MKVIYKGYEIEVERAMSMAGYEMLYTTIIRVDDHFIAEELAEDSEDTIQDQIQYMKQRIDEELKSDDPWSEKEEKGLLC